jgi:hypothetical protein
MEHFMSEPGRTPSVSGRSFLGGVRIAATGVALLGDISLAVAADEPPISGPTAAPIHLTVNGRTCDVTGGQRRFAAADTGFIGQNVYWYCASEGLSYVFRASYDQARLARTIKLAETQFIMFSQTAGYPKS